MIQISLLQLISIAISFFSFRFSLANLLYQIFVCNRKEEGERDYEETGKSD